MTRDHRTARILLGALVAATVATGTTGTASASPTVSAPLTLAATSTTLQGAHPSFCPFGKAHKHGKGCRGGSLVKGKNGKCLKGAAIGAAVTGFGGFIATGGTGAAQGALLGAIGGCAGVLAE